MEPFDKTSTSTTGVRGKPDLLRLLGALALVIITLCAIVSTVVLTRMSEKIDSLYNVTARPHCYLSPNDPRRRDIERNWGTEPTSEGTCDTEVVRKD